MTVNIKINDIAIQAQAGQTVLQAARENGITIPTLCYHKDLSPVGSCRLCVVEVDKWRGQVAACTLEVAEGMVVRTETPSLIQSRKTVLELLLENYYDSQYTSNDPHSTEFMHWVKQYDAHLPEDYLPEPRFTVDGDANPFVWVDFNKCILCTRCVRACAEVQGRFVWGVGYRGNDARIIAGADTTMLDARCESCGACVAYCPTGALDNKMSVKLGLPDKLVTTTCTYCGVGCQFDLNVKDGRIIRVTSNPNAPVNGMHLCVKGRYGYDFIHHSDRLTHPRVRRYLLDKQPKPKDRQSSAWDWVEVNWDTALDITAHKLAAARDTFGSDSVGVFTSAKCLNEENYLMNKLARQVIGTNNIDHCARL
jgi:formate dehydrogenase major subunit/formate dehydrogenase alpha subunit